jgi:hypothetical protein
VTEIRYYSVIAKTYLTDEEPRRVICGSYAKVIGLVGLGLTKQRNSRTVGPRRKHGQGLPVSHFHFGGRQKSGAGALRACAFLW